MRVSLESGQVIATSHSGEGTLHLHVFVNLALNLECAIVALKLFGSHPIFKFGILVSSDGFPSITALEAGTLEFSLMGNSSLGIFEVMLGIESLKRVMSI